MSKILAPTAMLSMAIAWAVAAHAAAPANSTRVGTLSDVYAWKNVQPGVGTTPSLHVIGKIVVPTPCHTTVAEYAGETKSNPPVYRVKISIQPPPSGTICVQVISSKDFRYDQPNYAGMHQMMEVFSDTDTKTVPIAIVQ